MKASECIIHKEDPEERCPSLCGAMSSKSLLSPFEFGASIVRTSVTFPGWKNNSCSDTFFADIHTPSTAGGGCAQKPRVLEGSTVGIPVSDFRSSGHQGHRLPRNPYPPRLSPVSLLA